MATRVPPPGFPRNVAETGRFCPCWLGNPRNMAGNATGVPVEDVTARVFEDQSFVAVFVTILLLGLSEIGYQIARRSFHKGDEGRRSQVGAVQGAVLGLVGLLLGFTFAMAVERFDTRRTLVLQEANAIGTTWLRANLLSEAHAKPVRELLRTYLNVRVEAQAAGAGTPQMADALRRSAEIQHELWTHAEKAANESRDDIT